MKKEKNDFTIKIFALIIAVVLWSYVINEKNPDEYRRERNIQVEYLNTEALDREGLIIMEPKTLDITVTVIGKKSDIAKFSRSSIKATVDLKGYGEGQKKIPINAYLEDDNNIKISSVEPSEVLFTFDKLISREKPITLKTEGELAAGNVLGDYVLERESIMISGPRTWLNEVQSATVVVDIDKQKENIEGMFPIVLLDDQGNEVRGIDMDNKNVNVKIPVLKAREIPIEPNIINNLTEQFDIEDMIVYPSSVELKGDKDLLNLKSIRTKPLEISASDFEGGKEKIFPLELELPKGVELMKDEKIEVKIKLRETISKNIRLPVEKIEVVQLNPEYDVDLSSITKYIDISVKGDKDLIEKLTEEDIKLSIDFTEVELGYSEVEVMVKELEGITIMETTPPRIEVYVFDKNS